MSQHEVLPRFIRVKDAPSYLGMNRHRFNSEVRPHITEIPIGIQGIAFDRLDLDAWAEHYKHCSGRPAIANSRSKQLWDAKYRRVFLNGAKPGMLKKGSSDIDFEKVLALSRLARRNGISIDGSRKFRGVGALALKSLLRRF